LHHDRFPENSAIQDVPDRTIRALPHLFEVEFFHAGLIRGDGGTLDTDTALFDGIRRIYGNLVIGLIPVFHPKVKITDRHLNIGEDEFVFDKLPDDPCHLIAIEFNNGIGNFNFAHLI